MAERYGIPVELLREGMPSFLQKAADGEVILGDYVRVATSEGLEAALKTMATAPSSSTTTAPKLSCYIVTYLPLEESSKIRELMQQLQEEQGLPNIVVRNMEVLEAKEDMLNRLRQNIQDVEALIDWLQDLAAELQPANPAGRPPLLALKVQYTLAKIDSDDLETAKEMLRGFPGISSNLGNIGLEDTEDLADHLKEHYPLDLQFQVPDDMDSQILAALSVTDWLDSMDLINDSPKLLECVRRTITDLGDRLASYQELAIAPSLIGAAPADFEEH